MESTRRKIDSGDVLAILSKGLENARWKTILQREVEEELQRKFDDPFGPFWNAWRQGNHDTTRGRPTREVDDGQGPAAIYSRHDAE